MHFFCLLFKVAKLAGGYFNVCYNEVLDKNKKIPKNLPVVLFLMTVMYLYSIYRRHVTKLGEINFYLM